MEIKIENYLNDEEIKEIIKDTIKTHVKSLIGNGKLNISLLAKTFAKNEIQELIPNFKELLNSHIQEQIKTITLGDFFVHSYEWKSEGNKIFNSVLSDNKELIQVKIRELFNNLNK